MQTVKLDLASGQQIEYNIGDQPFSPICDYMEQCEYKCVPDKQHLTVNEDTYEETFITMNIDVLVNRIKELCKERYVYSKKELILQLNHMKQYPLTQINSALSQLVDEESEYVFDMLGRKGKLVNIGEFYMFQPIEIDSTISVYDRKRPVAVKFKSVKVELGQERRAETIDSHAVVEAIEADFRKTLVDGVKSTNWYSIAGTVRKRLRRVMSQDDFDAHVIGHILDSLQYNEKIALYGYLLYETGLTEFEQEVRQVLHTRLNTVRSEQYIVIASYVKQAHPLNAFRLGDTQLIAAKPTEIQALYGHIKNKIESRGFNGQYGLMGEFKNKYTVFRIRDIRETTRQTGYRCDQKGRRVIAEVREALIEETGIEVGDDDANARDLCVDLEILFRYLTTVKKPIWFLDFETNIIANLLKLV